MATQPKVLGLTHGYLQGSYESSSGVCLFHMVASYILDQRQQTTSYAENSIKNCHRDANKTQTYNICLRKHTHFSYKSIYSSMPHHSNRTHNIHHISYTNIQHTSTLSLTTTATQQTFPQTPTQSLQQT